MEKFKRHSDGESSEWPERKKRKQKKSSVIKIAKIKGEEHVNHVGKLVNKRQTGKDCRTISILAQCWEDQVVVLLAKHISSGKLVAIKRFNMDRVKEDPKLVQDEIILTRQLQHPNILSYHTSFVMDSDVCVISPLMAFGSCKDLLERHFNHGLPENAINMIIKEVLEGLDYIHKKGFIHRAIRASHILISATGRVCLTGLRYACPIIQHGKWQKYIHSFPINASKNLSWLSPEVLEQNLQGYNEKSDIYSMGVVVCELANGVEPFAGIPTTLMLVEKVRGAAPQLLDCTTIPRDENNEVHGFSYNQVNRNFSEALHQLAALCLQREPFDRPTASQLCSHSYLKLNRRNLYLPELLKPALPLSERVAQNTDELTNLDMLNRMSYIELQTCEWDF
ncbi:hypothetical protein FQA39_LY17834 [Lamprigera yunnana]|nr:hypothetical protein FQA39_LY17834 [Lamprigera yunnana]